jgi:8-oxo-dGTP diphosphatase
MQNKTKLAGCIILRDNAILLLHRIKRGWYELPGGKINEGELPEATAIRELKEELCCDVEIVKHIGTKDFAEGERGMTYMWYLANIKENQEPCVGEEGFSHFKFIPLSELSHHTLSPNMKNLLDELQQGNIHL